MAKKKNTTTTTNDALVVDTRKLDMLHSYEQQITTAISSGIRSGLKVAHILYMVNNDRLYLEDGYADIVEWSKSKFGFAKTNTYNLANVGERFVIRLDDTDECVTIFNPNDSHDFNVTQLTLLLAIPNTELVELIERGEIYPSMTVAELKAKLTELGHGPKKAIAKKEEPASTASEEPASTASDEPKLDDFMEDDNSQCYAESDTSISISWAGDMEYVIICDKVNGDKTYYKIPAAALRNYEVIQ